MPSRNVSNIGRYRLTFEQLEQGQYYPTHDELKKEEKGEKGTKSEAEKAFSEWITTDETTTASKLVMAGILRAKANELDPPKPATRSYDENRNLI